MFGNWPWLGPVEVKAEMVVFLSKVEGVTPFTVSTQVYCQSNLRTGRKGEKGFLAKFVDSHKIFFVQILFIHLAFQDLTEYGSIEFHAYDASGSADV